MQLYGVLAVLISILLLRFTWVKKIGAPLKLIDKKGAPPPLDLVPPAFIGEHYLSNSEQWASPILTIN